MKPLLDFFKDYEAENKPWLICGKGLSLRPLTEEESRHYNVMTINHALRVVKADIAHIIDFDVVDNLKEILLTAKIVLMPYYPHFGFAPNPLITLEEWSQKNPILKQLRDEGRLFGYNLSTINKRANDSPVVKAQYFTSEASINLLAKINVKKIRTLGIDGGKERASQFNDLANVNKDRGYDLQWKGIRKSIQKYEIDFSPLGVESPIRIFIGSGIQQLVPALVLKHSILKHATMSVDVTIMNEWTHPMPKDGKNMPRTPFSFQRFMIPEKCGYKGHAIYMDSDMLVFGDVKEIWIAPSTTNVLVMRNDDVDKHKAKFSVFKVDCQANWNLNDYIALMDKGLMSYEQLIFDLGGLPHDSGFNPDWNSLEEYTEWKTKLLHYTEFWNQPWSFNPNHPLEHLWYSELKEAVNDGSIKRELIQQHVTNRWILPKCLEVL